MSLRELEDTDKDTAFIVMLQRQSLLRKQTNHT